MFMVNHVARNNKHLWEKTLLKKWCGPQESIHCSLLLVNDESVVGYTKLDVYV